MRIPLKPGMYRVLTSDNKYVVHNDKGNLISVNEKPEPISLKEAFQVASDWLDCGYLPTLELVERITPINDSEIKCPCGAIWKIGRLSILEEDCPSCDPKGWALALSLTDCKPLRVE